MNTTHNSVSTGYDYKSKIIFCSIIESLKTDHFITLKLFSNYSDFIQYYHVETITKTGKVSVDCSEHTLSQPKIDSYFNINCYHKMYRTLF